MIIRNEKLTIELHIADIEDGKSYYDFEIYDLGNNQINKDEDLWMKGFVRFDGCVNFDFNKTHSCGLFDDLIERFQWIKEVLIEYTDE